MIPLHEENSPFVRVIKESLTRDEVISCLNLAVEQGGQVYSKREGRYRDLGKARKVETYRGNPALRTTKMGFWSFEQGYLIEDDGTIYLRGRKNSWRVELPTSSGGDCALCIHRCKMEKRCKFYKPIWGEEI